MMGVNYALSLPLGGRPRAVSLAPSGQFTSRCPSAHTGADEGNGFRNLRFFIKIDAFRSRSPHQSRLRRASFPQGKPFTNPNLQIRCVGAGLCAGPFVRHAAGQRRAGAEARTYGLILLCAVLTAHNRKILSVTAAIERINCFMNAAEIRTLFFWFRFTERP